VFTGTIRDGQGKAVPIGLLAAARESIQWHVKIRGEAKPYDPEWERYFEGRLFQRVKATLARSAQIAYLWGTKEGDVVAVRNSCRRKRSGRSTTGSGV
jgi:RNA-directed DNA polymerase